MKVHRRWRLLAVATGMILLTGCLHYDVHIRVEEEEVTVVERLVMDPDWVESVGDTMEASKQVIERYAKEVKERGGKVKTFGRDSAHAEFRYDSLEEFAYAWPDTTDNRARWDRAVYRQPSRGDTVFHELVLFRMSPPDPGKEIPGQKRPILSFTVYLPDSAALHNADRVVGTTYYWRFTEEMAEPDSVHVVWASATAP
jgi:hypothetical protein